MIFTYYIYSSKCIKCNSPHKVKHYKKMAWWCKMNFKTDLPRFEIKKGKSCSYSFRYINCKGEHQANNSACLFWKHWFNKE